MAVLLLQSARHLRDNLPKACNYLREKYDIPEHQARYRVKLFEKFILNFFKNDYQFLDSKVVVD